MISQKRKCAVALATLLCAAAFQMDNAWADTESVELDQNDSSPVLGIERAPVASVVSESVRDENRYRRIDGRANNVLNPEYGAARSRLLRVTRASYGDGVSSLAGQHRPGAREISNAVMAQQARRSNRLRASDYVWQWGQFLDHDIVFTDGVEPAEWVHIVVPSGDAYFDPTGTGTAEIHFNRTLYDPETGTSSANPREQLNEITAWIDASNVYGSDEERAEALRTRDDTGRLRTSAGDLLPFNEEGLPNADPHHRSPELLFLAGDVRANEQVGLTAMHTLFVREHNRIVRSLRRRGTYSGDELYERARRRVGALMQVITYKEFIPAVLGPNALEPYSGYDPHANPQVSNIFAAAAYRFGHSMLNERLLRVNRRGRPSRFGHLALRDAFFTPGRLINEGGIEPVLRGLALQRAQAADVYIVDSVRNFLFGPPGAGGFDLAALNVQRGRDHGLPSYNEAREEYGLAPAATFADITSDDEVQARLDAMYGTVDDVDVWVGALAEDKKRRALVGPLAFAILKEQFEALRDGDRFWYERVFSDRALRRLQRTRLSHIIARNTSIRRDEVPRNVFRLRGRR